MLRLEGYWYIAAPSRDLGDRPVRRRVEGETLVLFRDSRGRPQALIDRCAHRGMALSAGRVRGDCIECPYHGWRYRGDGELTEVPALCPDEPLPRPRSMRSFPVCEQQEHVWVWLGAESPDSEPFRFPRYEDRGWTTFFMHTRFAAPVEECLENFLDVPHTIFVHPGLFRSTDPQPTRARVRHEADAVEAEFLNEAPLEGIGPRIFFPRGTVMKHTDRFILPSITRVDYTFGLDRSGRELGFVITSQCTQRAEHEVDVTTAITWRLPIPALLARPVLRWYCQRVIRQDVEALRILGEQQREFGRTTLHTSADLLGRHIRHMRRRAAEGVRTSQPETQDLVLRI